MREVFSVLTGVGVDVSKYFGAGALKCGAGVESESEKCNSAHLCQLDVTADVTQREGSQQSKKVLKKRNAECHVISMPGNVHGGGSGSRNTDGS